MDTYGNHMAPDSHSHRLHVWQKCSQQHASTNPPAHTSIHEPGSAKKDYLICTIWPPLLPELSVRTYGLLRWVHVVWQTPILLWWHGFCSDVMLTCCLPQLLLRCCWNMSSSCSIAGRFCNLHIALFPVIIIIVIVLTRPRRFAPVLTLQIKQTESLDGSAQRISHVGNFQAKDPEKRRIPNPRSNSPKLPGTTQPRRISRAIALWRGGNFNEFQWVFCFCHWRVQASKLVSQWR